MLHKTTYMKGFHIEATDGGIGHVDDFLVDESWKVQYLIIDTSNWPGGKWVLLPARLVEKVDSPYKRIYVKCTREEVVACASVDTAEIALIETLGPTFL
jgi:PRC-barrel domain protein